MPMPMPMPMDLRFPAKCRLCKEGPSYQVHRKCRVQYATVQTRVFYETDKIEPQTSVVPASVCGKDEWARRQSWVTWCVGDYCMYVCMSLRAHFGAYVY